MNCSYCANSEMTMYCTTPTCTNQKLFKPKEKPMKDKAIFDSIEQFNKLWIDLTGCDPLSSTIIKVKESGYIRKSAVEIAEDMLYDWKAGHTTDINDMVVKAIEAIQELKAENERLRK